MVILHHQNKQPQNILLSELAFAMPQGGHGLIWNSWGQVRTINLRAEIKAILKNRPAARNQ